MTPKSRQTPDDPPVLYVCYYLLVLLIRSKHRVHATLFMYKIILTLYNILEAIVEFPLSPPFMYPSALQNSGLLDRDAPKCAIGVR